MQIHDLLTQKRLRDLEEMVSEISAETLKAKLDNYETFQLIEVSNPDDFDSGHIAGAINVPLPLLRERASREFRKLQQLVVYCQDADSSVGTVAARTLQDLGFYNVLVLRGGKEAWKQAGFPLEGERISEKADSP